MADELKALIFDCDGVLADTERDGHRVAFNRAFADKDYRFQWDVALYKDLLKVGGGKERMTHFFDRTGWPEGAERDALIKELHQLKTACYTDCGVGAVALRPGVARLWMSRGGVNASVDLERAGRPRRVRRCSVCAEGEV
jgi:phosphoglycolate phosphatase-like HAD superfamily hydrolase